MSMVKQAYIRSKTTTKNIKVLSPKQKLFCQYYVKNFNATMSYAKAYKVAYNVAHSNAYRLMSNEGVKAEIQRLKDIRTKELELSENDIVEKYMKIAFSDMSDFVKWTNQEEYVIGQMGLIQVENKETGKKEYLKQKVNKVEFVDSKYVDGGLVSQIKQGKDGASIKLEDRQKALDWLTNFFEMNPTNKHKKAYDKQQLVLKNKQIEQSNKIAQARLKLEERKLNFDNEEREKNKHAIKEFIKATNTSMEDLKELFNEEGEN